MKIQIIDVLEKKNNDYKVITRFDSINLVGNFKELMPKKNDFYNVEIDILDKLIWGINVNFSSNKKYEITKNFSSYKITCLLTSDIENNLFTLSFKENIILVDITNLNNNYNNKWITIVFEQVDLYPFLL